MHLDLLMGVTAEVVAGHIAHDDHHGDGVQGGVGHAGDDVGQAGAQVHMTTEALWVMRA